MRHSLVYRVLAKVQTLVADRLMRFQHGPVVIREDIHLMHYTQFQKDAEAEIEEIQSSNQIFPGAERVLVVIPFRDKWEMTKTCLDGFLRQDLQGLPVLVALVDNGSVEEQTKEGLSSVSDQLKELNIEVKHLRYDTPFNFSYLNNQAVKDCSNFKHSIVALLNNDIEFIDNGSFLKLVNACRLPRAGAVSCTLLYPNGIIQHLFVFLGSKIVGSHPYKGNRPDLLSRWYQHPRAVGAVTGAVMFIRSEVFHRAGGFDESLPTSYQDVDLCLKLQKMGLVNWVIPSVMLIHHETQTRPRAPSWAEAQYVEKKWGAFLLKNPFVSPHWSRKSEHFVYTVNALMKRMFGFKL